MISKPALQNRVFNLICTEPAKISQVKIDNSQQYLAEFNMKY